jgi:hypothetical protein
MASYDEDIIQVAADALYARAASIVTSYTVIGVILGLIVGAFFANGTSIGGLSVIVGAVIGGYIGWWQAQGAAFMLRLQAQTALCQVQIEKNTRPGGAASQSRMAADANPVSSVLRAPNTRFATLPKAAEARSVAKMPATWWKR